MGKGITLAIQTIILLAIGIIVLVFVALWFSGAGGKLFGNIAGIVSGTQVDMGNITNATKGVMTGSY